MIESNEAERVHANTQGEQPPPVWLRLECHSSLDPVVCLARVRDVMVLVARARADEWPEDQWWERSLPAWFLESFNTQAVDGSLKSEMPWDFGSWVDAMKWTGWEWWSSALLKHGWVINLTAFEHPYSVGALEYVACIAGAESIEFVEV